MAQYLMIVRSVVPATALAIAFATAIVLPVEISVLAMVICRAKAQKTSLLLVGVVLKGAGLLFRLCS